MKYLITGGAGFVGSHLAEILLAGGHEVFVIDNLSTGSLKNIEHLKENKKFHCVIDTVMNGSVVGDLTYKCDVIFHLAAAVGVRKIIDSPVETIETNVHGTETVLKAAEKEKKIVLIASTSEVYGKSTKDVFNEKDDSIMGSTTKSRWSYACSKAIDEFLALAYLKEKGLPVIITRLFNTVGPRQTGMYGMVIPNFVRQALEGKPITVFGDGSQTRCFTYVTDVVKALIRLSELKPSIGQVFNIGAKEQVTITELAKIIKEKTSSKSEIVYVPYDEAYETGFEDMLRRMPDISKLEKHIGYKPEYNLGRTLDLIIEYFRKNKDFE
ncbi:MAG: GDP-mannose 4,6-dehydratase [Candidatus Aureabacteria bacterium]|nr:GDP-mannose 4,6-dehydratase [Candidatus Auribacterota bacterium]